MNITIIKRMEKNLTKLKNDLEYSRRFNDNLNLQENEIIESIKNQIEILENQLIDLKVVKNSSAGVLTKWFKEHIQNFYPQLSEFLIFKSTETVFTIDIDPRAIGLNISYNQRYQPVSPEDRRKFEDLSRHYNNNRYDSDIVNRLNQLDSNLKVEQMAGFYNKLYLSFTFSKRLVNNENLKNQLLRDFIQILAHHLETIRLRLQNQAVA